MMRGSWALSLDLFTLQALSQCVSEYRGAAAVRQLKARDQRHRPKRTSSSPESNHGKKN